MNAWKILRYAILVPAFLWPCRGQPTPTIDVQSPLATPFPGGAGYRFPANGGELSFVVGDPPGPNTPNARRVRYMLEGRDSGWSEPPGEMCLVVRFCDKENNQVAQKTFPCRGFSAGWKGSPEQSMFTHRQELVEVPAEADNLQIVLSSAGPATTVGILIVDDLAVSRLSSDGTPAQKLLSLPSPLSGPPPGWYKSGTHPSMATILRLDRQGLSKQVLAIVDDDPAAHAEWQLSANAAPKVRRGERISVEWNEMFSAGSAKIFTAIFSNLPPNRYRFVANELDVLGNPTARQNAIDILVPVPFWKTPWFLASALLMTPLAAAWATRAIIRVQTRRRLDLLQRERMVEQERLRIARDIHDDLGARLTHISLISGMAENDADTDRDRAKFVEISSMARELVFAMYETVWSVNPQKDHLESLVSFLCQSMENLCKPANIRCRIRASPVPEELGVRSEIRHNVILAVKESVHNAIKHSGASEIELQISFDPPHLDIRVSDNGCGYDTQQQCPGNGLKNIDRRMDGVGGKACIESAPNRGTQIHFTIPIPAG